MTQPVTLRCPHVAQMTSNVSGGPPRRPGAATGTARTHTATQTSSSGRYAYPGARTRTPTVWGTTHSNSREYNSAYSSISSSPYNTGTDAG